MAMLPFSDPTPTVALSFNLPLASSDAIPGAGESYVAQLSEIPALPDAAFCRAKVSGMADYAHCLVHHPERCRHALSFGFGFFCLHPQREEIIARTSPMKPALATAGHS